jgi:hypothetical protein
MTNIIKFPGTTSNDQEVAQDAVSNVEMDFVTTLSDLGQNKCTFAQRAAVLKGLQNLQDLAKLAMSTQNTRLAAILEEMGILVRHTGVKG